MIAKTCASRGFLTANLLMMRDGFFEQLFLQESWKSRSLFSGFRGSALSSSSIMFVLTLTCAYIYPPGILFKTPFSYCDSTLPTSLMAYLWEPPETDYVKINVHCLTVSQPLFNGNSNGVGVIIRDPSGKEIWSAAGPIPGLSKLQATLWGFYHGALQCHKIQEWKTHFESDHWGAVEAISFQEEFPQQEDVQEVLRLFNTLHANNFKVGTTKRAVTRVPVIQNGAAVYLAKFGMDNLTCFVETPGSCGEKQLMIERDMGFMRPLAPQANFGLGEVIDAEEVQQIEVDSQAHQAAVTVESTLMRLFSLPARMCKAMVNRWY